MRKYLRLAALLLPLLSVSTKALATCVGASGLPFNCTPSVLGPQPNDLIFGGSTTGAQNGQSVRWTWGQLLAAIPPTPFTGLSAALASGNLFVGNASNIATGIALSGDCTISNAGVLTCTKINSEAVTLGGTLTTSGSFNLTLTLTANTNVTLPTSGTLLTVIPNYITGVTLSNDGGTPNSKLDTAAGVAADSTNAQMITIGAFVKSTAGAWTSGTGNNGMGNGLTIANSTWYHVCLAYNGGTPDEWFDTSASCANKPAGVSGALFRRIGSFKTDSSAHIVAFSQNGDQFDLGTPVSELSGTPGVTTAVTQTLAGVPSGVVVSAILSGTIGDATATDPGIYLSSLKQTDVAANGTTAITAQIGAPPTVTALAAYAGIRVFTNTTQQIRLRVNSTTLVVNLLTNGWIDSRGK